MFLLGSIRPGKVLRDMPGVRAWPLFHIYHLVKMDLSPVSLIRPRSVRLSSRHNIHQLIPERLGSVLCGAPPHPRKMCADRPTHVPHSNHWVIISALIPLRTSRPRRMAPENNNPTFYRRASTGFAQFHGGRRLSRWIRAFLVFFANPSARYHTLSVGNLHISSCR